MLDKEMLKLTVFHLVSKQVREWFLDSENVFTLTPLNSLLSIDVEEAPERGVLIRCEDGTI